MPFVPGAQEADSRDRRPARPAMVGGGSAYAGPLDGRAYTCLMVALYVTEPAIVNLTVHDHVQLDRVTRTSAER